ncbi:MFS transporter [Succinivibrio sp.]|uniref:MFS transporter n=1 Tax=Succinivibrio sp. TaxID=2053619 RepID=UPI0038693623
MTLSTNQTSMAKVWSLSIAHFTSDFYLNLLPVMLPILALKFGFSYSQCGLLYMVFQISASFLQAPIGLIADRKDLGIFLPLSVLLGSLLACTVGICNSELMLVMIVFLSGILSSFFHPVAGGFVPYVSPKGKEVYSTSIFIVGGNVGFAVAPFLTAIYLNYFTPEKLIFLAVVPILVTVLLFRLKLYTRPVIQSKANALSLKQIITNIPFVSLTMSIGLRAICYCSLVIYIPLLYSSKGMPPVTASAILMTLLLGTAIGGFIIGQFSKRIKIPTLILGSYSLTIISMIVFLLRADDSLLSYVSIFVAGFGMYGATPPAIVWAQRMLPNSDSFATSIMLGFTFGIGYVLSVFIGWLGDYIGLQLALTYFTFPAMLLATLLIILIRNKNIQ